MFKIQSIFEMCPTGAGVEYQLDFPIENADASQKLLVDLPEGNSVELEITGGKASLQRKDGPGLWRFSARCVSKADETAVHDQIIVDVAVLEESPEHVKMQVAATIRSITATYNGEASWTQDATSGEKASALFLSLKGAEIPEVIRVIALERNDITLLWRHLLLLGTLVAKPEAKPYLPIIAEVLADVLCTTKITPILVSAYPTFRSILLKPSQKWVFYLKLMIEIPVKSTAGNSSIYYDIMCEIPNITPKANRPVTLQIAESICESDVEKAVCIATLFQAWNHKEGILKLLPILEMKPELANRICPAIQACNYREAIPLLLDLFAVSTNGWREILNCLVYWKVEQAKDLILERLEMESNPHTAIEFAGALKQFGDKAYREKAEAIMKESPEQKAKSIEFVLNSW